ncbi:hypothetical protein BDP27DRAFT_1367387 [Rhodocollybia butyracea]|uniref:Uncharacterized protein n=1 Tax=Rhodocollybia butyracea TaxID=206335 RepID=A0A9P5U3Z8_9AGAR|nr:hypothetical protein BDP27DRAFT_1367387 [Rhodocollybia butyracea]
MSIEVAANFRANIGATEIDTEHFSDDAAAIQLYKDIQKVQSGLLAAHSATAAGLGPQRVLLNVIQGPQKLVLPTAAAFADSDLTLTVNGDGTDQGIMNFLEGGTVVGSAARTQAPSGAYVIPGSLNGTAVNVPSSGSTVTVPPGSTVTSSGGTVTVNANSTVPVPAGGSVAFPQGLVTGVPSTSVVKNAAGVTIPGMTCPRCP